MDRIQSDQKIKFHETLRKVNILEGLSDAQLEELLLTDYILYFHQNDLIFEQGSTGNTMYIVLEGSVSLLIDPEKVAQTATIGSIGLHTIGTINAGSSFGELALFDQKPRSVTAIAAEKNTVLLALTSKFFEVKLGIKHREINIAFRILENIIKDISSKLRNTNRTIIDEMLSVYFIKVLVEELQLGMYECSYVNPLKQEVVIHVPEHFILNKYIYEDTIRKKEVIDIYFLNDAKILKDIVNESYPTGEVIFNTLLSVIRSGKIPSRVDKSIFAVELFSPEDFKKGILIVNKDGKKYYISWELKGIIHSKDVQLTYANLFLSITDDIKATSQTAANELIKTFLMPIQNKICPQLSSDKENIKYHVIVIHHRTNEVINTIEHLKKLNYHLDVVIGIPYGEVDWRTIITLDYASNHTFQSLKTILDNKQPTKYVFDFKASSFLSREVEKHFLKLFNDPNVNGSYITAMEALVSYSLVKSLKNCIEKNEKLIVFEDGGYIANISYRIYHDTQHPLHQLIKKAIDEKILIGVVEGTMSGERVHRKYLAAHENKALFPVLSSAVSQLKVLFESKGIAESVIYATSTALGRMGLPAFQERRIVVIGGNGTIGRRVIEQLVNIHNTTSELMLVDINNEQPLPDIADNLAYLKERIQYSIIHRYNIDENCDYFWLPHKYNNKPLENSLLYAKIKNFIETDKNDSKLLLLNFDPANYNIEKILRNILNKENINYQIKMHNDHQITYHLNISKKEIILLAKNTIISSNILNNFIIKNVDTVIGVTGVNVINAQDVTNFIMRKNLDEEIDQIVFVSGSSKDNEFKDGIAFLDYLIYLKNYKNSTYDKYQHELQMLFGPSFQNLPDNFKIKKYIHTDVGMSYNIEYNDQCKIFHMLANGLVINFFAKHEKGAKSEYIDPIITLQLLSVIRLAQGKPLPPALYDAAYEIGEKYYEAILCTINEKCKPMFDSEP